MRGLRLLEMLGRMNHILRWELLPILQEREISPTEMMVMRRIHKEDSCRVTDLACGVHIPPSTMTGVLDRLVARGWLERVPATDDRRSIIMKTTPALHEIMNELIELIDKKIADIFISYPENDYNRLLFDLEQALHFLEEKGQTGIKNLCKARLRG